MKPLIYLKFLDASYVILQAIHELLDLGLCVVWIMLLGISCDHFLSSASVEVYLTMVPVIFLSPRLWSRTQAWCLFPICLYVCGAVPYHGAIHRSASTFVEPHPSMVSFFRSASTFVEPYPRIVPSIGHIDCQSFDLRFEPLLPACKRVAHWLRTLV